MHMTNELCYLQPVISIVFQSQVIVSIFETRQKLEEAEVDTEGLKSWLWNLNSAASLAEL